MVSDRPRSRPSLMVESAIIESVRALRARSIVIDGATFRAENAPARPSPKSANFRSNEVFRAIPYVPTSAHMSDDAAWFIDGAYLYKVWQSLKRADRLDYLKLREYLERTFAAGI